MTISLFMVTSCGSTPTEESTSTEETAQANPLDQVELNGTSDNSTAGELRTVFFPFDSSSLSSAAKSALENNAQFLTNNPTVDIQIEGHCDERGGEQYNLALGERRARAVKDYLLALGVTETRMTIISFGKTMPLSFGHDETSWSQNRRANFVVTAK